MKLPAVEHVIVWTICGIAFVLAGTVAYCEIREIKPTQETLMMASGVVGSLVTLLAKPQPPVLPTTQETVTTTATSTTPP